MAYVLGFFAADGTMVRNKRGAHFVEFHITDRELLVDIRTMLNSDHKIAVRKGNPKHKIGYRLQIGSIRMFRDLERLGFQQGKSKVLALPSIPKDYIGDYVRGYFDGDGCVYFKKHEVKGRKNMRWIFQVRFTSGSKKYLGSLHTLVRSFGVHGGFIQDKVRGYELVFGHRDGLALYHLMLYKCGNRFRLFGS